MRAEVTDLIEEGGRIAGVRGHTPEGPFEVRADLVVGADGRHSVVRERAGLKVDDLGAPIDVLWMRLSKRPGDPSETAGRINFGKMLVMLDRGDYWQCAFVIRKDGFAALQEKGLDAFRGDIVQIAPFLHDRVGEVHDWDDIKLLTVAVDRLEKWWRPGLLCIGDAPMRCRRSAGSASTSRSRTRSPPATSSARSCARTAARRRSGGGRAPPNACRPGDPAMQVIVQERVIDRVLDSEKPITAPWPLRLFKRCRCWRASRRGSSAWGFARSMCAPRPPPPLRDSGPCYGLGRGNLVRIISTGTKPHAARRCRSSSIIR